MQDKDSEALRNQRRRRKRIGRIKSTIMIVIAAWIALSMLLIVVLFVRTISLEKKLETMLQANGGLAGEQMKESEAGNELTAQEGTEQQQETYATLPVSGISDPDNLAGEGDIHKVYLTFDDGPSENTEQILDILAEYGVKATFFVTGREDEESQALYRRIADEGHTLGMHSYANKYSVIYQSEEAFQSDYRRLRQYLYDVTGIWSDYYRFPGGSSNQISNVSMSSLIKFLNGEDIVYYDWNVSAGDAASTTYTAEEIVENVTEDVVQYKTSVILLHDSADKSTTVEAVGPLIEALQELGALILPIDEDTQIIQYVKADDVG